MTELSCCIHIKNDEGGEVKGFTAATLRKCEAVLKARHYHGLKYTDVRLPTALGSPASEGFHSGCYSRFTAIKSSYLSSVPPDWTHHVETRSVATTSTTTKVQRPRRRMGATSSGVLPKLCLFCGKDRRSIGGKEAQLVSASTENFEKKIRGAAETLHDWTLLSTIAGGDFVAKEVKYHKICSVKYQNQARRISNEQQKAPTDWHIIREKRKQALQVIFDFVHSSVILNSNVLTLKEIFKIYCDALKEFHPDISERDLKLYSKNVLSEKLLARFPGSLLVDRGEKEQLFINSRMKLLPAVRQQKLQEMKAQSMLREAAHIIRKEILSIEKIPLPGELSADAVMQGECSVPPNITSFLQEIIEGPTSHRGGTDVNKRRISSLAQDLIFITTKGQIKPEKHLTLGATMKSLTGSRKVIDILNRFGHCSSYSTIEGLETELAYSSSAQSKLMPPVLHSEPNLCTGVAFDNFDRYVETLSGKNTLHDTVGIVYQNVSDHTSSIANHKEDRILTDEIAAPASSRQRRAFQDLFCDVEPYTKRPRLHFQVNEKIAAFPKPIADYRISDLIWQMCIYHKVPSTPMWVGFNSQIFQDDLPLQKISYLPQINVSPTSNDAVQHTLKMAQQVAAECGQQYIICTYDLAIAKMALAIQTEEAPHFDNVFIMFGAFHIEMAFFKALGKIVDGSGIAQILTDSDLLAQGSMNGFLSGTHYNRCRRLYPLLAVSLRVLHYDGFLREKVPELENIPELVGKFKTVNQAQGNSIEVDEMLLHHINLYTEYEKETREGQHGCTAQFWILFLDLIDLYHDFTRSVRMGDIHLFMSSLEKITDIFFAMNHPNYARWMVIFYDKVSHCVSNGQDSDSSDMSSSLSKQLKTGLFSIRRTHKNFSRTPPDLTLEQTINADASNKLTGLSSFTNSITARQRWAVSHAARTSLISHVMDKAGLVKVEDVSKETKANRISKDQKAVAALVDSIENALNPFDPSLDSQFLFNLSSGKSATEKTRTFLLGIRETGRDQHSTFRKECATNPNRFGLPIKRNKLCTFSTESVSRTLKNKNKEVELKIERDLFGRLIALSLQHKLDLKSILEYPLTPIPLSLCHPDGSLQKTNKSSLMKHIEKMVEHDAPTHIDEKIIDGFHFLHQLIEFPPTFGGVSKLILRKLERMKVRKIHMVFDNYVTPSIKDIERCARAREEDRHLPFHISGSNQTRPPDFLKALRRDKFKEALVTFLVEDWQQDGYAAFFEEFTLYVTCKFECFSFTTLHHTVQRHTVPSLHSTHLEADSRMIFHLSRVQYGNVVVSSADTDVLIILIGNVHILSQDVNVWMETGTFSRNDKRFLNIQKITDKLGPTLSRALPAFHCLTGCDYTASFYKVGKVKPFKLLEKSPELQNTLASLQLTEDLNDDKIDELEKFVCSFYRKRNTVRVNELRLCMFLDTYQPKDIDRETCIPFKKIKGMEPASMPPCKKVLIQKIKRCQYITAQWSNLHRPNPPMIQPELFGWQLKGDNYIPVWYLGNFLPDNLAEVFVETAGNEEREEDEDDDVMIMSTGDEASDEDDE